VGQAPNHDKLEFHENERLISENPSTGESVMKYIYALRIAMKAFRHVLKGGVVAAYDSWEDIHPDTIASRMGWK
jgi:hypothetical protein